MESWCLVLSEIITYLVVGYIVSLLKKHGTKEQGFTDRYG